MDVADRVVVLTGAAGGIGRCIARRLGDAGAVVALVDRDEAGLAQLADTLPRASTHPFDLARVHDLPRLAESIAQLHGGVDVLVHNAGLTVHGTLADMSTADIDRVLDVDLRAVVHGTHAFLPYVRTPGHIVIIASMAGMAGFPFQSTYSAAKFALRGFGQALRPELAARGVGVSTILPGTIATGFLAAAGTHDAETSQRLASLMERYGTPPQRVANAVHRAIRRNRAEIRVGWDCHLVAAAQWACPPLIPWALRLATRRQLLGTP